MIGRALYGKDQSLSLATLLNLVKQGHVRQVSAPSLGGTLQRHWIDADSVDAYIKELEVDRGDSQGAKEAVGAS